jgi:metallopeptidase family M12-like protein/type IX secretion system substrate protein
VRNLKLMLVLIILTAFTIKTEAKEFDASEFVLKNNKNSLVQSDLNRYDFDILDTKAKEIFNSGATHIVINNFPIRPDYSVKLVLSKHNSAFSNDINIKYFKDGKKVDYKSKNNARYYGHIDGQPNSDVYISYSSLGLIGFIQDVAGQMYDVSSDLSSLGGVKIPHNVSETTIGLLNEKASEVCGMDEFSDFQPELIDFHDHDKNNEVQKNDLYEVKIAADGNFELYIMFSSFVMGTSRNNWESWFESMTSEQHEEALQRTIDYIENVMSAVSRIYTREAAVIIKVSDITIFNDPFQDPYYSNFGEGLQTKLSSMRNIWLARPNEAKDRVLATLFSDNSRQPSGSSTLGIAYSGQNYSGTLCNTNQGYSALGMVGRVEFPRVTFSQDVQVAAHEFGHNFGCPHTHFCGWPQMGESIIDSCVSASLADDAYCISNNDRRTKPNGTIMSYCHFGGGIEFKFHPRMVERIRKSAKDALKSCVTIPKEPVVRLVRPIGGEEYFAGSQETIAFNAANVSTSKLFYSSNRGETWNEIGEANTDKDTLYTWTIPSNVGTQYMVRIESANDPSVFDQSELSFNVTDFSIVADFPKPGQRLGYLTKHRISWVRYNVGEVNIKLSTNNGESFESIGSGDISSLNNVDFPDIATDKAILLVESKEFPNVNLTVPFTLGKETVDFSSPMTNDTLNSNLKKHTIKFNTDFVNSEFELYYRADQSGEWKQITKFNNKVDLQNNQFVWDFDATIVPGQLGELRAQVTGNDTPIGETGVFYFEGLSSVGKSYSNMFTIESIVPNPAGNTFTLTVNNSRNHLVRTNIRIVGYDGRVYQTIGDKYYGTGQTPLEIDITELPTGTYYVMIETDKYKDVQQLKVVR